MSRSSVLAARRAGSWVVALVALAAAGCSGGGGDSSVTVSAAASLEPALSQIGDDLRSDRPDIAVSFNFDSSSRLATQILEGAPADVFASADQTSMQRLVDAGLAEAPVPFARNELAIVTAPGNPLGIRGLEDLAGVTVVSLCATSAPCGQLTESVLERAEVRIPEERVSRAQNARAALAAVSQGDAAAGIVYRSDALSASGAVETLHIPGEINMATTYLAAVLTSATDPGTASEVVERLLDHNGQNLLRELGFLPPP